MQDILERFKKNLKQIEYPHEESSWNIAGILKNHNAFYRFDVRDVYLLPNGKIGKEGKTDTKADKMVFENKKNWIILDLEELNKYVNNNKIKEVYIEDMLNKLEWNIIINK